MRRIIFYSWQSDLPNACNRGLIQSALEAAAARIASDDTIDVEPVVDRDTQNTPGSPDIASTIFAKIAAVDLFVADVSIISRAPTQRSTPNPNVLIEFGYALKALGPQRVILVFNTSFGTIEELPFDLRMRRILPYEMRPEECSRAPGRHRLSTQLETALRVALEAIPAETSDEAPLPVIAAIEMQQPNRALVLRRALVGELMKIDAMQPRKPRDGGTVDELIDAIEKTAEVVAAFSRIAESASVVGDETSLLEMVRWFGKLLERYNLPQHFSGSLNDADHDYYKFLGHEMFVTLIAFLVREGRWDLIQRILDESIPMSFVPNSLEKEVRWDYASDHLVSLLNESPKRRRVSMHADLLSRRHGESGIFATVLPLDDFMAADFFLFLASFQFEVEFRNWRAWSCLYLKRVPSFIRKAERAEIAKQIARALGMQTIDDLKKFLTEKGPILGRLFQSAPWMYPVKRQDIDRIGTR